MKIWSPIKFTIIKIWKSDSKSFLIYLTTSVIVAFSSIVNTFTFKEVIDAANRNQTVLGLSVFGVILLRLIYEIFKKGIEGLSNYSWFVLDSKQAIYMNKLFVDKVATLGLESFENPETVGLKCTPTSRQ